MASSSLRFHELDHVFLQSQARIWLEETLHTRFDDQISICDLLADGELLFEISEILWNMLLVKYMELNSYKPGLFIPVVTRNRSGRYRPYSNVDSFLKVCKVLGLSGVDLFSPSDVVEKRDTRKVCICIRSLSKKARSKQLNVPDFDNVTNTVAMPTDIVRCIRRSLELSALSVIHGQSKHTRLKSRQKNLVASHTEEDESCHEEPDGSESNFSDTSYADFVYLELDGSPKTDDNYVLTRGKKRAEARNQETVKFVPQGSAESLLLQYDCSDNQVDEISSPVCESRLIICDGFSPINQEAKFWNDCISDATSIRILTNVPFHISEDCTCHSCMGTESHSSNRAWKKFPDDFVGRVLDFDATSEPDDLTSLMFGSCDDGQSCGTPDEEESESLNQISEIQKDSLVLAKDKVADSIQVSKKLNDKGVKMDTNDDRAVNKEKRSAYIAPLLKTVVKGTALIGVFFLLHFRNTGHRNSNNNKSISQIHWKSSGVVFSNRKGETGSKIHPLENFKFGD